ncbi:hypothetical protein AYX07_11375 [Thermoactinomyces sp. AS95]|nr:hypothetical protein JS81_11120 [Thermoactinomyces sp. Gus2-1]KYQ85995.1 hypothetical protein AYX07_11375 [Thermoactinomyces sp. AS95]
MLIPFKGIHAFFKGDFTLYIWGSVGRCSVFLKSKSERKRKRPRDVRSFFVKMFQIKYKMIKMISKTLSRILAKI